MFRAYHNANFSSSKNSTECSVANPLENKIGDQKRKKVSSHGKLLLRIEDLDFLRCKNHFLKEMLEDLRWFGIHWHETSSNTQDSCTSNIGSETEVEKLYTQSKRLDVYRTMWRRLFQHGYLYPSPQSRRDLERAISAPHEGDMESIFPIEFRPDYIQNSKEYPSDSNSHFPDSIRNLEAPTNVNWRFRVPDGRKVCFHDKRCGLQSFECGIDFGDFLVWRGSDNIPSYEFAVVVDDIDMGVTEIVRGEDLLVSTARQILLYEALASCVEGPSEECHEVSIKIPAFYHCPLARDETGRRLAKRCPGHTLRSLRLERGYTPIRVVEEFFEPEAKNMFHQLQQAGFIYLS